MATSARQQGENAALALRQRLSLGHGAVDLEDLVARRGALVFHHPFAKGAPDGMYVFDGQTAIIVINASKETKRQRFTLAHELGHHELHRVCGPMQIVDLDVYSTKDADGAKDPDEVAANAFAAHLLLPLTALEDALGTRRNRNVTVDDLVELVRRFRVSWETACWRLYNEHFIRRVERDRLLGMPRTPTLARHGIDERHYALTTSAIPPELAHAAADLWAGWQITDERLAQILELSEADALRQMSTWGIERANRERVGADAGEHLLSAAGIDVEKIAATARSRQRVPR